MEEPIVIDFSEGDHRFTIDTVPNHDSFVSIVVIIETENSRKKSIKYQEDIRSIISPYAKESAKDKDNQYENTPEHQFILKSKYQLIRVYGIITDIRKHKIFEGTHLRFCFLTDDFEVFYGEKAIRQAKINTLLE